MILCKYCEKPLAKSRRPNKSGSCRSCKHKDQREKYPERHKERWQKYYQANADRFRETAVAWRKNNPDLVKAKDARGRRTLSGRFLHGKYRAKRANMVWNITKEQYAEFLVKDCFYCRGKLDETGSGLDRVDNSKGYEQDNIVPCCGDCNAVKGDVLTGDEMKLVMSTLTEHRRNEAFKELYS